MNLISIKMLFIHDWIIQHNLSDQLVHVQRMKIVPRVSLIFDILYHDPCKTINTNEYCNTDLSMTVLSVR